MSRIEIIVPTRDRNHVRLSPQLTRYWSDRTSRLLCSLFGGCTRLSGYGDWMDDGEHHSERVIYVWSWGEPKPGDDDTIREHCEQMRQSMNQVSVAYAIDHSPTFVA